MLINDRLTPPTKQWPSKSSIQQSAVTLGMKLVILLFTVYCLLFIVYCLDLWIGNIGM